MLGPARSRRSAPAPPTLASRHTAPCSGRSASSGAPRKTWQLRAPQRQEGGGAREREGRGGAGRGGGGGGSRGERAGVGRGGRIQTPKGEGELAGAHARARVTCHLLHGVLLADLHLRLARHLRRGVWLRWHAEEGPLRRHGRREGRTRADERRGRARDAHRVIHRVGVGGGRWWRGLALGLLLARAEEREELGHAARVLHVLVVHVEGMCTLGAHQPGVRHHAARGRVVRLAPLALAAGRCRHAGHAGGDAALARLVGPV